MQLCSMNCTWTDSKATGLKLLQSGTNLLSCYITVALVGYLALRVKLDTSTESLTYGWQVQSPYHLVEDA